MEIEGISSPCGGQLKDMATPYFRDIDDTGLQVQLGDKLVPQRVIGAGGMGAVLEVYHRELGVKRAIKLIDKKLLQKSEQMLIRFAQEARIASELSHPNIVKVFDLDRTMDGTPFILMEYLDGKDLEEVIATQAPVGLEEVIRLLSGPADALDAVHRKGVIHRDLKPANLFLTKQGTVKIVDFGISQMVSQKDLRITRAGEIVGTPMYMSPEQLSGDAVDGRADVYALGIIAYELLVGQHIFKCESFNDIMAAVLHKTPNAPSQWVPTLPCRVDGVFEKVFQKDPANRYSSAIEFLRELAGSDLVKVISSVIRKELVSAIDSSEFEQVVSADQRVIKDNSAHYIQRQKIEGKLRKMIGPKKVFLGAVLTVLIALGSLLFFVASPTVLNEAHIEVDSVSIELSTNDKAWETASIRKLLDIYLALDPIIETRKSSIKQGGEEKKAALHLSSGASVLGISIDVEYHNEWRVNIQVRDEFGVQLAFIETIASGFDDALEMATWKLGKFIRLQESVQTKKTQKEITREWVRMAWDALKVQGLLNRLAHVAAEMGETAEGRFFDGLFKYLQCASKQSTQECLRLHPFAPHQQTDDELIDAIWRYMRESSVFKKNAKTCDIFLRTEPELDALLPFLPNKSNCSRLKKDEICTRLDTFGRRFQCAKDSFHNDGPDAALEYLFLNMKTDLANLFYANIGVMSSLGMSSQSGKKWLFRMQARYGMDEPSLAGLHFWDAMAHRDSAKALIWARRAIGANQKVGLALHASGWLKEGVRKETEVLNASFGELAIASKKHILTAIRNSFSTVLVTSDASLAKAWLAGISSKNVDNPFLRDAIALIKAIADKKPYALCHTDRQNLFVIETDYVCGRFEKILKLAPMTPDTSRSNPDVAYLFAESLLKTGRRSKAIALFKSIESTPVFRVNFPVSSITALKRLGDIHFETGKRSEANQWYRKYISIWDSLDVPMDDYWIATKRISN